MFTIALLDAMERHRGYRARRGDDESLHDLVVFHHLVALKRMTQSEKLPTEPSEGNFSSDWMEKGLCLAAS